MALLFFDGFDHYTTLAQRGWTTSNSPVITTGGRTGPNCLRCSRGGATVDIVQRAVPSGSTIVIGAAIILSTGSSGGDTGSGVFALGESGTWHISLSFDSANRLQVRRGDFNGTVLATATNALDTGVWHYIECKVVISDTTGSVEVRVNNVGVISLTNVDTRNGGTGVVSIVQLSAGSRGTNFACYYDDLYIDDSTFRGDSKIEAIYPTGAGSSTGWTRGGTDSGANWSQVDEAPPNDDTDYVTASTVGAKDLYTYGDLATTTGVVHAVQTLVRARKDDATDRRYVPVAKLGVTEADGAEVALGTSYATTANIRETKPGGGAWTISDVNAAVFGFRITV